MNIVWFHSSGRINAHVKLEKNSQERELSWRDPLSTLPATANGAAGSEYMERVEDALRRVSCVWGYHGRLRAMV